MQIEREKIFKISTLNLLQFTILVTVFSQISAVQSFMRPLMYVMWIVIFLLSIVLEKFQIRISSFTRVFLLCYSIYAMYCILCELLIGNHLNSNYLKIMRIPLLVSIVGDNISTIMTMDDFRKVCRTYCLAAVIFALYVQVTYFSSYSMWLKTTVYSFSEKNSAAQIWSIAVLIILFVLAPANKQKTIYYIAAIYLVIITGFSQCRTALLALGCVLMVFVIAHSKHKIGATILLCIIGITLLTVPITRGFIDQVFMVEKYAGADLNKLSSNRLVGWAKAWNIFCREPILGVGEYYLDFSYLSILTESGIIGFLLIETIWAKKIFLNLRFDEKKRLLTPKALSALTVFYFVESMLEGYPPFGPGVSSFMFWLITEIEYCSRNAKETKYLES